jgi:squalene synthase HpnC
MPDTMQGIDHYENFPVASWLCPAALRAPTLAIYHFARTADDLADEGTASADQRLADLRAFRAELEACTMASTPSMTLRWPQVFGPLAQAMAQHRLPAQWLHALLDAFEQDVIYTAQARRYPDRQTLLDYCARSANPVGRLLLHLYGVDDAASLQHSDAICSALQLINFWQDRAQDMARGRDYLPIGHRLRDELGFARSLMQEGRPLVHRVPGRAGWELRGVVQGGLRILDRLDALSDAQLDDPAHQPRPRLGKRDLPVLLWRTLRM